MDGEARCECPPYYMRTMNGILKIVEMVLTILVFAISFGGWWSGYGGGWVEFTGISCFITITIWFILHLINWIPQIFLNFLFEFISYCIMTILLLISAIVAAARAGMFANPYKANIGACSFFAFAATFACGFDAVLLFLNHRQGKTTTTTTTTTTTNTAAAKVEY